MNIRLCTEGDLPEILAVYDYARDFMARTGNPNQWGRTNPPEALLRTDIECRQLYAMEADGKICGVFAFIPGEDPTYGYIEGNWHHDIPYGTIHRIAGNGREKGILYACLEFCQKRSRYLRIDTHRDNLVMQHLLGKNGFSYCGIIYLANGDPRLAFDRFK